MARARGAVLLLTAFTLVRSVPVAMAQTPQVSESLPAEVAEALVAAYNDESTIRIQGGGRVPAGTVMQGDLAVLEGAITVAGQVRGDVFVLNGDLLFEPGAHVLGTVIVAGGSVVGGDVARVEGGITVYRQPLAFRRLGERLVYSPPQLPGPLAAGREVGRGRIDFTFASQGGYNRVEGLPIAVGPRVVWGRTNPTRAEALVVYRTADAWPDSFGDLGHVLRVEQLVGGREALLLGIAHVSQVVPIEEWGLSSRENSLSTFLFRRDFRDHYQRDGWSAYLRLAPPARSTELALEYRHERHESAAVRRPLALRLNGRSWRPQPLVAEGSLRSIVASVHHDTRNVGPDPSAGWHILAAVELGLGGDLADPLTGERGLHAFRTGFADVRRYARMGPRSRLALRLLLAGSLVDRPLPPQRQHALGGLGSLPVYPTFAFDCGARSETLERDASTVYPHYGCDRSALLQLEYHAAFPGARRIAERLGWLFDLGDTPGWLLFLDAGRAWNAPDQAGHRTVGLDDFVVDAGAGLRFGRIGAYWGVPLSGRGRGLDFFVRVGPRF